MVARLLKTRNECFGRFRGFQPLSPKILAELLIKLQSLMSHPLPIQQCQQATKGIFIRWVLFQEQTEDHFRLSGLTLPLIGSGEPEPTVVAGAFQGGPSSRHPQSLLSLQQHSPIEIGSGFFQEREGFSLHASHLFSFFEKRYPGVSIDPEQRLSLHAIHGGIVFGNEQTLLASGGPQHSAELGRGGVEVAHRLLEVDVGPEQLDQGFAAALSSGTTQQGLQELTRVGAATPFRRLNDFVAFPDTSLRPKYTAEVDTEMRQRVCIPFKVAVLHLRLLLVSSMPLFSIFLGLLASISCLRRSYRRILLSRASSPFEIVQISAIDPVDVLASTAEVHCRQFTCLYPLIHRSGIDLQFFGNLLRSEFLLDLI